VLSTQKASATGEFFEMVYPGSKPRRLTIVVKLAALVDLDSED
jgi:hypothetical protein